MWLTSAIFGTTEFCLICKYARVYLNCTKLWIDAAVHKHCIMTFSTRIHLLHGSLRSWYTFFKDFSRTFEVHFQGLFFVLSNIHSRKMDFSNKTYRDHLIFSSQEKWWGGDLGMFLTFLDDLLYYGYNTGSNNSAWKGGVWGSSPGKFLLELVQNPAILDNSGGYTSLLLCHNKSRDCPFWNRLIHWTHNIHKYL